MLQASDIAGLLTGYSLGAPLRITHARHGYVNETAFVETEHGMVVVRRCHPRLGAATAAYRHALVARLRERGVPAPATIPDREGRTFTVIGGRVWEVQEFVAGDDYEPERIGQTASAAALLGGYHHAIDGFEPPAGEQPPPRYAPRAIRALTEPLLERDMMGELHEPLAWYDGRAAELGKLLPESAYAALPHLVIHGDIHADNVRFHDDRAVALLDFDQAGWDARAVDLADALVAFATEERRTPEWQWGVFAGPLDCARASAVLAGYGSVLSLTAAERAALPVLLEVLWLRGSLGRVVATPEGAPDYHLAVLGQGQRLSEWLAAHWTALG